MNTLLKLLRRLGIINGSRQIDGIFGQIDAVVAKLTNAADDLMDEVFDRADEIDALYDQITEKRQANNAANKKIDRARELAYRLDKLTGGEQTDLFA